MDNDQFENALSSGPTEPEHSFAPPPKPKSRRKRWLIPTTIVVVLLGLAGGGYAYWQHTQSKPVAKSSAIASHQAKSQTDIAASQKVPTKSYSSTNFALNFNYPEAWTVADSTGTPLTVTSPITQITDNTGATVSGKIVMTIQQKGQVPTAFGSMATAVIASQKVDYTQPTSSQRASTYLTFVQYTATKPAGSLDSIYITGNYGYQKAQNIPSTDVVNIDPLVTVSFQKCADAACTANLTALSIKATDWSDASFQAPIKTLLTSLAFN